MIIHTVLASFGTLLLLLPIVLLFQSHLFFALETPIFLLCIGITIFEIINRSVRQLARLGISARVTAQSTMLVTSLFLLFVWGPYFYNGRIPSTELVLSVFFGTLLLESLFLFIFLSHWYKQLPGNKDTTHTKFISPLRLIKSRLQHMLIDLRHLILSGHLIVPSIALAYGVQSVGAIKMAIVAIRSISTVLEKIVERTATILFAHAKQAEQKTHQRLYTLLNESFHALLIILSGISFIGIFLIGDVPLALPRELFEFGALFGVWQIISKLNTPLFKIFALQERQGWFIINDMLFLVFVFFSALLIEHHTVRLAFLICLNTAQYIGNVVYAAQKHQLSLSRLTLIVPVLATLVACAYIAQNRLDAHSIATNELISKPNTLIVAQR